jgi:ABC-type hemin transport system ATPase subunit
MNAAGTVAIDGFANQAVPNLSGGANAQCLFSGFLVQVAG